MWNMLDENRFLAADHLMRFSKSDATVTFALGDFKSNHLWERANADDSSRTSTHLLPLEAPPSSRSAPICTFYLKTYPSWTLGSWLATDLFSTRRVGFCLLSQISLERNCVTFDSFSIELRVIKKGPIAWLPHLWRAKSNAEIFKHRDKRKCYQSAGGVVILRRASFAITNYPIKVFTRDDHVSIEARW